MATKDTTEVEATVEAPVETPIDSVKVRVLKAGDEKIFTGEWAVEPGPSPRYKWKDTFSTDRETATNLENNGLVEIDE